MLIKYHLKALLTNKALWGWAVLFMGLWLFLGSYVFGSTGLNTSNEWLENTAVWFSIIGLISGSVIGTPVSYSVYYASSALSYGFRYTKLKPGSYIFSLMGSTAIVSMIAGIILMAVSAILFSLRSGYTLLPASPLIAVECSSFPASSCSCSQRFLSYWQTITLA